MHHRVGRCGIWRSKRVRPSRRAIRSLARCVGFHLWQAHAVCPPSPPPRSRDFWSDHVRRFANACPTLAEGCVGDLGFSSCSFSAPWRAPSLQLQRPGDGQRRALCSAGAGLLAWLPARIWFCGAGRIPTLAANLQGRASALGGKFGPGAQRTRHHTLATMLCVSRRFCSRLEKSRAHRLRPCLTGCRTHVLPCFGG